MEITIPKQSVPPCDNLMDAGGNPALFSKAWWLALNTIGSALNQVQPASGSTGVVTIEEFTLNTATTVVTPASIPSTGALLRVILTQDATGGRQITWAANVKWARIDIDTTALTVSVFEFMGRVDPATSTVLWFACGIPLTGETP